MGPESAGPTPFEVTLRRGVFAVIFGGVTIVLLAGILAFLAPLGWVRTLTELPDFLWSRLPHVSGMQDAIKDGKAAAARTEASQTALREQAAATKAALAAAERARRDVIALKRELAAANAALAPLRAKIQALEAEDSQHRQRITELEAALAKVQATPVAPIESRREAVEALRRLLR